MERLFHEELRNLTDRLVAMGALVENRVRDAMIALVERNPDLAGDVATSDASVNSMEVEVDDLCFRVLALQHPVASDLRRVRSIMKVNTDLERVGDQAVNIGQAAIDLIALPPGKKLADVTSLSNVAIAMLHDSLDAFVHENVAKARLVLERDNEADELRDTLFRVLLTHMLEETDSIRPALGLMLVCRCLERVADHATNIAEDLIFLVEGRDVRHNRSVEVKT